MRIGDYKYIFMSQPDGWFGSKQYVDWPILINLRADPVRAHPSFPD